MACLLRNTDAARVVGLKYSQFRADVKDGLITPGIKPRAHVVAWPDYELAAINRARISGKSDAEIRELVARLVEARKTADGTGGAA